MRMQAQATRKRKGESAKDLRESCGKLTLTATLPMEDELLSRLYRELAQGQSGSLLYHLREVQDNGKEIRYIKPRK